MAKQPINTRVLFKYLLRTNQIHCFVIIASAEVWENMEGLLLFAKNVMSCRILSEASDVRVRVDDAGIKNKFAWGG